MEEMVTVVCGEDIHFIPGNKLIDQSQFFARALAVPMVEKKERKVIIKDIESGVFAKVVKFLTEGLYQFDVKTEAWEALEAADRFDIKELKKTVCIDMKGKMEIDNVKAVLSLAERSNAKQLFKAAFAFMHENGIKLEMEDVAKNPNLALAFVEESRLTLAAMKEELVKKDEIANYFARCARAHGCACGDIDFYEEVPYFFIGVEEEVLRRKYLEFGLAQARAEEGAVEHRQDGVEGHGDEESEKMEEGQSGMKELAK